MERASVVQASVWTRCRKTRRLAVSTASVARWRRCATAIISVKTWNVWIRADAPVASVTQAACVMLGWRVAVRRKCVCSARLRSRRRRTVCVRVLRVPSDARASATTRVNSSSCSAKQDGVWRSSRSNKGLLPHRWPSSRRAKWARAGTTAALALSLRLWLAPCVSLRRWLASRWWSCVLWYVYYACIVWCCICVKKQFIFFCFCHKTNRTNRGTAVSLCKVKSMIHRRVLNQHRTYVLKTLMLLILYVLSRFFKKIFV